MSERWTKKHDIDAARMQPAIGQWAVSNTVHSDEDGWGPDGCFPVAWRDTFEQACAAAVEMSEGEPRWVARVVKCADGWTLGQQNEVIVAPPGLALVSIERLESIAGDLLGGYVAEPELLSAFQHGMRTMIRAVQAGLRVEVSSDGRRVGDGLGRF